jgi:hypothetical protein
VWGFGKAIVFTPHASKVRGFALSGLFVRTVIHGDDRIWKT